MRPREPLRFPSAAAVVAGAFAQLEVPERLTVSEAALKHRVLSNPGGGYSGPWTFDRAPYTRRPMDCLHQASGYAMTAVMGPAQSAKSEIGNNWMLHTAICDPANMLFVGPDKATISDYVIDQIDKMINLSPELQRKQLGTESANNRFLKQFMGCNFFMAWPVKSQFRARPAPRTRIDDYDALPQDIDGEGSPLVLISGRQTTFEGFEMTYVNSSPALGTARGIEAIVAAGTDERWHVRCLQCDEAFLLDFDSCLQFDKTETPDDARTSAHVVCPECGYPHPQREKAALMARGAWLGPEQHMQPDGTIVGELRPSSTASFRIDGLMGFASWGRLAELYRTSELTFERTQDEAELKAFYNTRAGKNYKSRLAGAEPVATSDLERRVQDSDYDIGTVPDWCQCLTAAVDVQGNRFEILVVGWGEGWQSARIDRFPILALDDGETRINPAHRAEHWGVLLQRVFWRRYPCASDPDKSLAIMCAAIDTGGIDGVTDNAFAFWSTAVSAGVPATAITLIKGGNIPKARLLPAPTIDAKRKGAPGNPDPELFVPNVNRIKSIIDVRLRRDEPGPGYMAYPREFETAYLDETTAENKVDGVWVRPHGQPNETLDLEVYNYTNMVRLGGADSSLAWVPAWARPRHADPVGATTRLRPRIRSRG